LIFERERMRRKIAEAAVGDIFGSIEEDRHFVSPRVLLQVQA
jgi:hypothetical protein